jgi:hypothetical protein
MERVFLDMMYGIGIADWYNGIISDYQDKWWAIS